MKPRHRANLPQVQNPKGPFLTRSGVETYLLFKRKVDLPCFASINLMRTENGQAELENFFVEHCKVAFEENQGFGLVLDSPTWRGNPDWAEKLGFSPTDDLEALLIKAAEMVAKVRDAYDDGSGKRQIVLSGQIGPRADGYQVQQRMTAKEAEEYHSFQIGIFANKTPLDMITAFTLNYPEEAVGIANAAKKNNIPVVISFTLGKGAVLPSGHSLKEAIEMVEKETDKAPVYYSINCTHPSVFLHLFDDYGNEPWLKRLKAVFPNASKKTHEELDGCDTLDEGDPVEIAKQVAAMRQKTGGNLNVLGGCCGTCSTHINEIAKEVTKMSH